MATYITISQLKQNYQTYLQANTPGINAFAPNTFWDIDAGAMAAILLDLYGNLQIVQNSIYPQTSAGDQIDQWLYARGLPARGGVTYGQLACSQSATSYPVTIPAFTIFTSTPTGNQYQTLQSIILTSSGNPTSIALYAVTAGSNVIETNGTNLVTTIGSSVITLTVSGSVNGQLEESDQSCITRILQSIRAPQAGARTTDYYIFALQAIPNVITDAIVIPGFYAASPTISTLGVIPLVGTFITQYQLDQGLISGSFVGYNRTANSTQITTVTQYINNQRLVGIIPDVVPNNTININTLAQLGGSISINVALVTGYTLSTTISVATQDNNNNPITANYTVQQIIQKVLRSAICNQPYGGVVINGINYITLESLSYIVNQQLGQNIGQLAQILTNVYISGDDIVVPNYTNGHVQGYIQYTYDVSNYSVILVNWINPS